MEKADGVTLQRARISRAYLDQAKSFGIEQDIEFCPCLDTGSINAYNQAVMSGYTTPMMNPIVMRHHQQQQQQQQTIDSESIFKILAAAAANINNAKNVGSTSNGNAAAYANTIQRPNSAGKGNNANMLKNNLLKNQSLANKNRYLS